MAKVKRKSKIAEVAPKTNRQYQIESDADTLRRAAEVRMSAPRFGAAKAFLVKQQKAVQAVIRTPKPKQTRSKRHK